jgi:signal transduction histidine kinase
MILVQRIPGDESQQAFHFLSSSEVGAKSPPSLIDAALKRPSGNGHACEFHSSAQFGNGDQFLAVTQPVANGNLGLVILQNRDEALADARRVLVGTLFTMAGALLVVGPIAFFLARSISRPVKNLAETANEVAEGNLHSRVETTSQGELRKLITDFNSMVASLQDSTENLQRTVDARTEALKRSNDELQHFASVAAHDLNAPLRTVGSFVDLIEKRLDAQLDDKSRGWMERVRGGLKNMRNLIDDLLTYSRIESRAKPHQPLDCGEIFRQAVDALDYQIKETGAKVTCRGSLPSLRGDASQLQQLFQNLISNGVKYQKPGVIPEVEISARPLDDNSGWEFQVADNGIGISRENIENVFGIFQRLHSSSEYSGTGIGLAVCRKVAQRHGGEIWVESEPGRGSVFHFTLRSSELSSSNGAD